MRIPKILHRELEVAFSRRSQSDGFRILKYFLLAFVIYHYWGSGWLWIILSVLSIFSVIVHFWFRYKTKGWTQSYGLWKYDTDDARSESNNK